MKSVDNPYGFKIICMGIKRELDARRTVPSTPQEKEWRFRKYNRTNAHIKTGINEWKMRIDDHVQQMRVTGASI